MMADKSAQMASCFSDDHEREIEWRGSTNDANATALVPGHESHERTLSRPDTCSLGFFRVRTAILRAVTRSRFRPLGAIGRQLYPCTDQSGLVRRAKMSRRESR